MLDMPKLFETFSSSPSLSSCRQRAMSNPSSRNRMMDRHNSHYNPSIGGNICNGNNMGNNIVLPPIPPNFVPIVNRITPNNNGLWPNMLHHQSINIPPINNYQYPSMNTLNSNIIHENNNHIKNNNNNNNIDLENSNKMVMNQNMQRNNNTNGISNNNANGLLNNNNKNQIMNTNSLIGQRGSPHWFSASKLPTMSSYALNNNINASGIGGSAAAKDAQQKIQDYLSMTYGGVPAPLSNNLNPSQLLPMRLIGDVIEKDFQLGKFLGEGGAIRFYLLGEQIKHEFQRLDRNEWETEKQHIQKTTKLPISSPPLLIHDNMTLYETLPILRYLSKKMGQYGCDHVKDFVMDAVGSSLMGWRKCLDKAIYVYLDEASDSENLFSYYIQERGEFHTKFEDVLSTYIKRQQDIQNQQYMQLADNDDGTTTVQNNLNVKKDIKFFTGNKAALCDYILFSILFDDRRLIEDFRGVETRDKKNNEEQDDDEEDDENNLAIPDCFQDYLSKCPRLLALHDEIMLHPHINQFIKDFDNATRNRYSENIKNKNNNSEDEENVEEKEEKNNKESKNDNNENINGHNNEPSTNGIHENINKNIINENTNVNINNTLPNTFFSHNNNNHMSNNNKQKMNVCYSYYPMQKMNQQLLGGAYDALNLTYNGAYGNMHPMQYMTYGPSPSGYYPVINSGLIDGYMPPMYNTTPINNNNYNNNNANIGQRYFMINQNNSLPQNKNNFFSSNNISSMKREESCNGNIITTTASTTQNDENISSNMQ